MLWRALHAVCALQRLMSMEQTVQCKAIAAYTLLVLIELTGIIHKSIPLASPSAC